MKQKHNISLPQGICANLSEEDFDKIIHIGLKLEPLWENALGKNWKTLISYEKLKELYKKM